MGKFAASLFALMLLGTDALANDEQLDIDPVYQLTPVWCWIAVGEMTFKHYDLPNVNPVGIYQCGIVGTIALGGTMLPPVCSVACQQCTVPAGTASRVTQMLELYPRLLRHTGQYSGGGVAATHRSTALSSSRVVTEIDDENPIIAGISPTAPPGVSSSVAAHVALIIGYEEDGDMLIVNDPFPFDRIPGMSNPYLDSGGDEIEKGQYSIAYDDFRDELNWSESWTVRKTSGGNNNNNSNPGAIYPNFCCTVQGRQGPFPNPGIPRGDFCTGFFGAPGRVCD